MKDLINSASVFTRRPKAFIFLSIPVLVFCIVEYYFIIPLFIGTVAFERAGFFKIVSEGLISLTQLLLGTVLYNKLFLLLLPVLTAVVSLIISIFLSGYFEDLNNYIRGNNDIKGTLLSGIKRHFVHMAAVTFITTLISIVFFVAMMVVSIPCVVVLRAAAADKPQMWALAVFVGFITAFTVIAGSLFFRVNILFWYAAVANGCKNAFASGRHIADSCFWKAGKSVLILDLIFVIMQIVFTAAEKWISANKPAGHVYDILIIGGDWFIKSLMIFSLLTNILYLFKTNDKSKG